MPYLAYITRKVFADGSDEIRIKHNPKITIETIRRAQRTKHINKLKREQRKNKLKRELFTRANVKKSNANYNYATYKISAVRHIEAATIYTTSAVVTNFSISLRGLSTKTSSTDSTIV